MTYRNDDPPDYYDEPETEEEIAKAAADAASEQARFDAYEDAWWAAKCKCRCGRYIGLWEFYHDGICNLCEE